MAQTASGTPSLSGLMLFMMVPMMLFAAPILWLMDGEAEQTGFMAFLYGLGMLAFVLLAMVGAVAGLMLWFMVGEWWDRRRGITNFSGTTQVTIDEAGLHVDGLGSAGWADVLSLEGVPDSDTQLFVHTRGLRKLMLTLDAVEAVVPVFEHHMARHAASQQGKLGDPGADDGDFRALVFHWPRFMAWIALGYALGGATCLALIIAGERSFLTTLVVGAGLAVMVAWLVWAIPISQLSTFSPGHMRGFKLDADRLRSTDGQWQVDLGSARIQRRQSTGFGYALDFISIRPPRGRRLDLLLSGDALEALTERWGLERPARPAHD